MCNLQKERNVVNKPADKGTAVAVWDRNDFLKEAEKQLSDKSTYLDTKVIKKDFIKFS